MKNACLTAVLTAGCLVRVEAADRAEIVDVRRIWDKAPHCAFTDLIRHRNRWYCVFREGPRHAGESIGVGRVLTSADGVEWDSAAILAAEGDVRDPKISVTPDDRLMVVAGCCQYRRETGREYSPGQPYQTLAWFSRDGTTWEPPREIGDPGWWLWRVTWHAGRCYGFAKTADFACRLYRGDAEARTALWSDNVFGAGSKQKGSEASLLFLADGQALCVMRGKDAAGGDDAKASLGRSHPPYKEWTWQPLEMRIGGPQVAAMPDGRIVVAGRFYGKPREARLWWLDPASGRLDHFLTLSQESDSSYCGLVFHEKLLWVSYYSGTKQTAAVYLARVKLPPRDGRND